MIGQLRYNTATTIQYIMIVVCIMLIALIASIFVYADKFLSTKATETNHARIDAELASQELINLQNLEKDLTSEAAVIQKTQQIVAESQKYQFQNQVIEDITSYARQYDITILGFDFGNKPGAPPNSAQSSGTAGSQQRTIVSLSLQNNIPYTSFIQFLKAIENNVTKMQLTGVQVQPMEDPNFVQSPTIDVEVFLR